MYSYEMEHKMPWYSYRSLIKFVIISYDVTDINIGKAFQVCENLIGLAVDNNNSFYSNDENGVLFNKNKTELIQYPCGNTRKSYVIPDDVISIGHMAFRFSNDLTKITIPESITNIGYEAFYGCDNLTDVYYDGNEEQWEQISIDNENECLTNANIHFLGNAQPVIGDINGDKSINSSDALLILQAATGKLALTEAQKKSADVNQDSYINSGDALCILQYATGLIKNF